MVNYCIHITLLIRLITLKVYLNKILLTLKILNVDMEQNDNKYWNICSICNGQGKKRKRIQKKIKLQYKIELKQYLDNKIGSKPNKPKGALEICTKCKGSGLENSNSLPITNNKIFPKVAIIGSGIGGVALAIAFHHRGIPFTLYERDEDFKSRSQGYGLTLQQASKAMKGFGIFNFMNGIVSTKHIVHDIKGNIVGEWGMRKWLGEKTNIQSNNTNIHIARQSLRLALLEQLNDTHIQWGHQLLDFTENNNGSIDLQFKVGDKQVNKTADLIVGADGIRSTVRSKIIGDKTPLNYLGCMVILGICPLDNLDNVKNDLLDGKTVFQTANGIERIYVMPFGKESVMWQLSFPIDENKAKDLNKKGAVSLKDEASSRTQWHDPIPQIVSATPEDLISGYPAYDRSVLDPSDLDQARNSTLLGDAAHPMSPFKGQGANQALLDALSLARTIYKNCNSHTNWEETNLRETVLKEYEKEMLDRSSIKVLGSANAAKFLHSDKVLIKSNEPRRMY